MDRIFELTFIVFLLVFGIVAGLIRMIVGAIRGESATDTLLPALETLLLTIIGGFLSRTFISLLLTSASDSTGMSLFVGWGFFFPVGVIDTIIFFVVHHPILTRPEVILWIAAVTGGFSGMMAGIWRIYDWTSFLGYLGFFLDSTWGLSGTFDADLLHLINFAWGDHADQTFDRRRNNHRYKDGFRIKSAFAFTQGAVMSNLKVDSSNNLWHHENTHVWQNRAFGPLFTMTYVGWMALLFVPSLIIALVKRSDLGDTIMAQCYYNNPWEVWAYKIGGWRKPFMLWPDAAVIAASVLFYGTVLALMGYALSRIY